MVLLALLLGVRLQRLTISQSSFKNIAHGGTLMAGCDYNKEKIIGVANRIKESSCSSLITIKESSFSNINYNSWGGAAYIKANAIIHNSNFSDISADYDGGAIYFDSVIKVEIVENKFSKCTSKGSGGGIYFHKVAINITIKGNTFLSCTAGKSGAGIYSFYTYITSKDDYSIYSESNEFNGCKSEISGTFYIDSYNIDISNFYNDRYINCESKIDGGGFMSNVGAYVMDFKFVECSFSGCTSKGKGGGMQFNIEKPNSLIININGCIYDNCSANYGSCIGAFYSGSKEPIRTLLTITGSGETSSCFKNIKGLLDEYAIYHCGNEVKIINAQFDSIKVGVLKASATCFKLNLTNCEFNNCDDSVNYLINSTGLINFTMVSVNLINCGTCFNVIATNTSINELTLNNSKTHFLSSSITSNSIDIKQLNIHKYNEKIYLIVNQSCKIYGGNFSDTTEIISIEPKSEKSNIRVTINSVITKNARMFSIDENINTFEITNSEGSYAPLKKSLGSIIQTGAPATTISNCNFSTKNCYSIVFPESAKYQFGIRILDRCNFEGSGPFIKVGSLLSLLNCSFMSDNKIAIEVTSKGELILGADSNCIPSPFKVAMMINEGGKVNNDNLQPITKFYYWNNRCFDESSSPSFSQSMMFIASESFSETERFRATADFSYSSKAEISFQSQISRFDNDFSVFDEYNGDSSFNQPDKSPTIDEINVETSLYLDEASNQKDKTDTISKAQKMSIEFSEAISSNYFKDEMNSQSSMEQLFKLSSHETSTNTKQQEQYESTLNEINEKKSSIEMDNFVYSSLDNTNEAKTTLFTHQSNDNSINSQTNENKNTEKSKIYQTSLNTDIAHQKSQNTYDAHHSSHIINQNFDYTSQINDKEENSKTKEKQIFSTFQTHEKAKTQENTVNKVDSSNKSNSFQNEGFFHEENVEAVPITNNKTGMIAGIVVAGVAFMIICSLFICCIVIKKNRGKSNDTDAENYTGSELETEASNSSSYTDYEASCLTQEMTGTAWTTMANMKDADFFDIDDDEEPEKEFLSD